MAPPPRSPEHRSTDRPANPVAFGLTLALVGLLLLANNLLQGYVLGLGAWLLFAGPGVIFLSIYLFQRRHLGFIIPGALLTALGILFLVEGVDFATPSAGLFLVFLGLPFVVVWYAHTRRLPAKDQRGWPLLPGVLLTATGTILLVLEWIVTPDGAGRWGRVLELWPAVLVVVGLVYVVRGQERRALAPAREN